MSYKILNAETYKVTGACLCRHIFDEVDPEVERRYWSDFLDIFSAKKFKGPHGEITIFADWRDTLTSCQQRNDKRDVVLELKATGLSSRKYAQAQRRSIYAEYIELFLNDVFLTVNISAPGGFELYGARLERDDYVKNHTFQICSDFYNFARGIEVGNKNPWPNINLIQIKEVNDWLVSLHIGTKQMSTSKIEKALFSFLHLAYVNDYLIESILWLSYALESLYDTPFSGIKKTLLDRVCLVLGPPSRETKRSFGKFYDIRSALFHGRMEIYHPMKNELLDSNAERLWSELPDYITLATAIVIATIQKLVLTRSRHFTFTETFACEKVRK